MDRCVTLNCLDGTQNTRECSFPLPQTQRNAEYSSKKFKYTVELENKKYLSETAREAVRLRPTGLHRAPQEGTGRARSHLLICSAWYCPRQGTVPHRFTTVGRRKGQTHPVNVCLSFRQYYQSPAKNNRMRRPCPFSQCATSAC